MYDSQCAYEVCVNGRATLVMCPVSLAGQWIEQAELTWGDGLRIHQAPSCLCCLEAEMLQSLLACMSRRRSVCVPAAWLAPGHSIAFLRVATFITAC